MTVTRFVLHIIVAQLLLAAVFFVGLATAAGPGMLVTAAVLVLAALLLSGIIHLQTLVHVEMIGVVRRVSATDYGAFQMLVLTVRLGDTGREAYVEVRTFQPALPHPGTRIRMLVPIHRPFHAFPVRNPHERPLTGPALLIGRRRRRLPLGRFTWPAGRPLWQARSFEWLLEVTAEVIAGEVLGRHRRRCETLAEVLHAEPEFVELEAVFDTPWPTVVSRAVRRQAPIWEVTTASRSAAARALLPLPFLAIAAGIVGWFVVPDLFRVLWAGLRALSAGSVDPLLGTVHWTAAVAAAGLPPVDLGVLLAAAALVVLLLVRGTLRAVDRFRAAHRAWRDQLVDVLRERIRVAYQQVANRQDPVVLRIRNAPGLAGVTAAQTVARGEAVQLRRLAFDLGAGAVAISGSRGVGKTTLLGMLTADGGPATLGVLVSAPVRYEPRDFLLHLYAQLCRAVLARLGDRSRHRRVRLMLALARRSLATLLRGAAVLSVLLVVFVGTREWLVAHLPVPRLAPTCLVLAAGLALLARWVRGREPVRELALAAEAARRLRQTRFLQTVSSERTAGVGQTGVQAGWRRARQWAEQPPSLPELVESYRGFATSVASWWRNETQERGKLLIAVDEADRIADPQLAEQFINEIKATFGVPHCVYLVSVSEEALANFERRVVRMRTVFDSAFDTVVRLRALTLRESVHLLRRRVAGVPDPFWILCHCMSGGMPRDVLRMARTMLDIHRAATGPSALPELAERLVALEVRAVKRGFQQQAAAEPDPMLPELLADVGWPGRSDEDLRRAAEEQLAGGSAAAVAIAAAFLYYATVLRIFTARPDLVNGLRALVGNRRLLDEAARLAVDLGQAHSLLAFDPAVAIEQLRGIRARLE